MLNTVPTLFKSTSLITSCLFALSLSAADTPVPENTDKINAVALNTVEASFPAELRIHGKEAWVQLAYIVDKNGNAIEPVIEGSVGGPEFEKTALEALTQLKYTPAKYKGETVEQSVSGLVIPFVLEQIFEGADTSFANNFNEMTELFNLDKNDEANIILGKLENAQDLTLLEVSMLEIAKALNASKNGDDLTQLTHLRNASVNNGQYLPKEMLIRVLEKRFALAAKYSLFDEAFKTYELLENVDPLNEKLTSIAMMIAPIQNAINDGRNIIVRGQVNDNGYWSYTPLRRVFSFAAAEENVKEFEPRCEFSNKRFPVNTSSEWKIPDSWGKCSIVVYGEPGAKFALYEFSEIGAE